MRKPFVIALVAALATGFGANAAQAATLIDFANLSIYGAANGQTSWSTTDQGVGVGLSSSGGTLRATLEGLGINGPTRLDDSGEVGFFELLTVDFTSPQFVAAVNLEQLFQVDSPMGQTERGKYSINGGPFVPFVALNSSGLLTLNIGAADVSSLRFSVPLDRPLDDYSLRSLSLTSVPEPASLFLLGSGLAGVLLHRRRSHARK
jgi:hypothetical protein